MKDNIYYRLVEELDYLGMDAMACKLERMLDEPSTFQMPPLAVLEAVVDEGFISKKEKTAQRLLKSGRLAGRMGDIDSLHSKNGRLYNEPVLEQVKALAFISNGKNVCVFGASNAGKSFLLSAIGREACLRGSRCLYTDYMMLMDELVTLRVSDVEAYKKKLRKYSSIPILIIDDFLSEDGTPEVVSVLFQLVKQRDEKHLPTLIGSQYDPGEWGQLLCGAQLRKGEADSIRRRLTGSAYIVEISLEGKKEM